MDPISAIGIASAILQFLDVGIRVANKFTEYVKLNPGDVPKSLESVTAQLPLLLNALGRIQSESQIAAYDPETRWILHGIVIGCLKLARELDELAVKISPKPGESLSLKVKKVLSTFKKDERIDEIDRGLRAYVQVLILHQVVNRADVPAGPPDETEYFDVRELPIKDLVPRPEPTTELHKRFYKASRSQLEKPEYVFLQGEEGVGKSQVAYTYCKEAYDLGHFRTVFWLDAATPELLRVGLESAASKVRKTKVGDSREKLEFFNKFLTERWQPWLLVLDGYQHNRYEDEILTSILPQSGNGAFLITTRDIGTPDLGTALRVRKFMTPSEDRKARFDMFCALLNKELDPIIDALDKGFDPNCYSATVWKDKDSPMINVAAEKGFDDAVRLFLEMGAEPKLDKSQGSALGQAAHGGHSSVINILLDHEESTGYQFDQHDYDVAAGYAIGAGKDDALQILLKRRPDKINVDDYFVGDKIGDAGENGHIEILRILSSHDKLPKSSNVMATTLIKAVEKQNVDMLKFLVTELKADVNTRRPGGEMPLHAAMEIGGYGDDGDTEIRHNIISFLLENGASPNVTSLVYDNGAQNNTPLHLAARKGRVPEIEMLLKHGADPLAENEKGETPLKIAMSWKASKSYPLLTSIRSSDAEKDKQYYTDILFTAARAGDRELVLPVMKLADINSVEAKSKDTPLLAAIRAGALPVARMLVRNGASQTIVGQDGKSPMLLAAEQGMDLLLKDLAKAKDSVGLEAEDARGNTPLMLAVRRKHENAVKVLLQLGADKDAMNQFAETALDIAEESREKDIIKLLDGS